MYGDIANKLILEAKRSVNLSEVPLYQTELVKDIIKEINDLNRDADYLTEEQQLLQQESQDGTEEESKINQCQLFVTILSMRRNKRCLLAYEKLRADKLVEFSWLNVDPIVEGNDKQPTSVPVDPIYTNYTTQVALDNLNHAEQEFLKNYQELLLSYKSSFSDVDLSGDLNPPTNIFIDVRVLKDGGEVQTEYGSFNLIKDSQFYVRKSDVERLIQQGYLEEI
ncbi:DNA replication complex GINS protein PSF1 [Spathaspora passalidarum NRRL Y-27907]|uniref:DNA replication complex GINS protein PSF1 n=1 Tax=Spathaspora passalidarum (strain NRRL Y-27907 / 11-Y1) TaxID=619300 RepID=G3AV44_SPAPN|nr:DNA replication complex GINS protein PSF1 [Spathaspora passalidarum NRRL Y-27907]EGW30118.1 DNA replication complex GINS protein PSF1 [Spathaspora passalidarum NRRL Y-27907]